MFHDGIYASHEYPGQGAVRLYACSGVCDYLHYRYCGYQQKVRLMKPWQNSDDLEFGEETDIATGIIDDLGKYLFPIEANHFIVWEHVQIL